VKKNSIKKNYFFNLIYQILAVIVPFITTPYVSRVLGATSIGDYNYVNGIVSCFGLMAVIGTVTFGNREIAVVQNDREKRSILFFEILFLRVFCTGIALVPYFFFIYHSNSLYRILYLVNLLLFLSWILDVSWFCQGMENFGVTAIRNSIVKILGVILIFTQIKSPIDLWKYTMIYAGVMLFGNATMWFYIFKEVSWPGLCTINIFRNIRPVFQLFIPVVAVQIYTVMDKIMLGYLDNTTQVGYYSQGQKIIELAITFVNAFISVLFPRIAFLFAENSIDKLEILLNKTLRYIFLLSIPMVFGCLAVIDQFVPLFFGKGYEPVGDIIKILSVMFIILNLGRLFGTILVAIQRQNQYTVVTIIAAILNLFLNYVFILNFHMGAVGVAIASVISETIATLIQLWDVHNFIKINMLLKYASIYMIPTLVMLVAILACRALVPFDRVFLLLAEVIIGVGAYFAVLLLMKDEIVYPIFSIFVQKLHRI